MIGQGNARMNAVSELRGTLLDLARRSVSVMKACNNEESIKLYLVLPMIGLLGYDSTDPLEVYPNHETDLAADGSRPPFKADFAILSGGQPVIAFAAGRSSALLSDKRDAIANYFAGWPSTKLACVTNGILFEFYVDSTTPGAMDAEPFLTVDLETIAQGGVPDDIIETLVYATKGAFDPDMIAERAHLQLVRKRLRTAFVEEAQTPSDAFCQLMMQRIGFGSVPAAAITRHYAPVVKAAFEEALVLPVVQRLRAGGAVDGKSGPAKPQISQRISAAERELAVFNAVRRRLAFLVGDNAGFEAIERVDYKDFVGKVVVYFDRDPKGRLFELIRGADGFDKFIFPDPHGEIITNDLAAIDGALKAVFEQRVREIDGAGSVPVRAQRSA
jgi:hypothetical protein